MSITQDLRELLNHYIEINTDNRNLISEKKYGGIRKIIRDSDGLHSRDSIPGALTYSEHGFFVEPMGTVISYKELEKISTRYSKIVKKNKSYSNIIDDAYDNTQLIKAINDNWDEKVYSKVTHLLDDSIHMFIRYFNIAPNAYKGENMFFYPMYVRRIIDDEVRYKKSEEDNFNKALSLSQEVKNNLSRLSATSNLTTKNLEDSILRELFKLHDKDFLEFIKSGYVIGGNIVVKYTDWKAIGNYWELIKQMNPNIFISNRFIPNASYSNSYPTHHLRNNFIDYIEQLFAATDIESAWLELSRAVYAAFYDKPIDA